MPQAVKWASTERFPTTDTEGSSSSSPVSPISTKDSGIAMDSDTDPQASCSSSPAMKIAVPSSMLTWSELILIVVCAFLCVILASTTYFVTISRADRDSTVRQQQSDDSRTACYASFSFKWRSGASARDQTPVGCDPFSAEAEGVETPDLSAVDALLQLQTRC
jgi:hypothetical protein